MSLGKLKQLIFRNQQESANLYPILGFSLRMAGNGTANPTIINSHNITSVSRFGVGIYQVLINQETILGLSVIDGYLFDQFNINTTAADTNYQLQIARISPNIIGIQTYQITGASSAAYDLTTGDTLDIGSLLYNGLKLPPP